MNEQLPTRTRAWRDGVLVDEGFALDQVSEHLDVPESVVWVDLCNPSRDELQLLVDELSLHELAVEDALGPHQRPKLDHYDTHEFLSVHAVRLDPFSGELEETEVDAFVNSRWLITIRKTEDFSIQPVLDRWDRSVDLMRHGVSYLLYALLDEIIDEYFAAIDAFDEYYDAISEALFDERPLDAPGQRQWFTMRRSLVRFHRLVVATREALSALMRREHGVTGEIYPYYQDVYDHILRITETSDSLRDLGATIVETNLALRDYRQNQIVKKVTSWAAIVAVPTLITGYYGMNVPYPGSGEDSGVVVATALSIGIPIGLFAYFRRRDWL